MLRKWVSRLLGEGNAEIPDDVPAHWAGALERVLAALQDLEPAGSGQRLARDLRSYVLTGQPLAVLSELADRPELTARLKLAYLGRTAPDQDWLALYRDFNAVPDHVALRWAKVLAAAVVHLATYLSLKFPRDVTWPEVLICSAGSGRVDDWNREIDTAISLTHRKIEALLAADGLPEQALMVSLFAAAGAYPWSGDRIHNAWALPDFPLALDRHLDAIRPLLGTGSVAQRQQAIRLLGKAGPDTLARLTADLARLATAGARQLRLDVDPLIQRCGRPVLDPLREIAQHGGLDERVHALRLLHELGSAWQLPELQSFAHATAAAEKASAANNLLLEWAPASVAAPNTALLFERSSPDWSAANCRMPEALLERYIGRLNQALDRRNAQLREEQAASSPMASPLAMNGSDGEPRLGAADIARLQAELCSGVPAMVSAPDAEDLRWRWEIAALVDLAADPSVSPEMLLKLLRFVGHLQPHWERGRAPTRLSDDALAAIEVLHRQAGRPDLLALSGMLEDFGVPGTVLLKAYCQRWGRPVARTWPAAQVWPFFMHHLEALLVALLDPRELDGWSAQRARLFQAVDTFPELPPALAGALFTLALGGVKADRLAAQQALERLPGKEARIVAALTDGKAEVRTAAAAWLGNLRSESAIPALEQAVAREKLDVPKGAMLDALVALGQPVEKYLDRDTLARDASRGLAKGVPKELEWFPWSTLPEVRWASDGTRVADAVLRWLLTQACRQKSPEPNAVLRKYCGMFDPRQRERLGQFVLEAWIGEDLRRIPPDEAERRAQAQARSMHAWMSASPANFSNHPDQGKTVEQLVASYLPAALRELAGTAIGSKGLLALVAACAGEAAVAPTWCYLKDWYGQRAGQGKALIAMLAWIDHPGATQLVLAIGSRFRTRGFQEEATRQAEALAERRGWTLDELADRTVPSAGFDEHGVLELSYGARSFSARLLPDFTIALSHPDGRAIAALPEPRQDEDAECAADARKALSAARKDLKTLVQLQTDRLHEALCTQREWRFGDWSAYLQAHPVLRHLVQRLVWAEVRDGRAWRVFRPLDDGTFTDRDDNPVVLAPDAGIRVAHDSLMDAAEVTAWQQHLLDYAVQPLFEQFGNGHYTLPPEREYDTVNTDFEGWLIEAFTLRTRATRAGYSRSPSEAGGWFYSYERRFPTLGLKALITFSGNRLPEENRVVALHGLSFVRTAAGDVDEDSAIALCNVPAVLLSECHGTLRRIAAEGTGHDPEWRNRTGH